MKNNAVKPVLNNRLMSLDALRGLDMFFLVGISLIFRALPEASNNKVFLWLSNQSYHPDWHGFTIYDLVFPLFIFIAGVAMPFSFSKRLEKKGGKRELFKHVLTRTIVLTIIGAVLWQRPGGAHPHFGYYSVLYRIGISYFFAAIIMMNTKLRGQIYWAFGLTFGYWLLLRFMPVPDYGTGDFTEEGNLATHFRNIIANVISPKFSYVFSLTLITSIANALFGVIAGQWLKMKKKSPSQKTLDLLAGGAILIVLGLLIHLDFPINKKLGTSSFTFLTCGISTILLAIFYWIIDVKRYRKWAFFLVVVGLNPLTIYVANFLFQFNKVTNVFTGVFDFGNLQPLFFATTAAIIKWLFLYYLYKQKVFLKI